ncbi:hypothetical protein C8R44DRAFT_589743, partial [Mycena epipterygia]
LASTSAAFLTNPAPMTSASCPPCFAPNTISPMKQSHHQELLDMEPLTEHECLLQNTLRETEARDRGWKEAMLGMQAMSVLQGMYADRAHSQLQAQEEKKNKKKQMGALGDGMPKLLTGDKFYNAVVANDESVARQAVEAAEKSTRRAQYAREIAKWKKKEEARKVQNDVKRGKHQARVRDWEQERDSAKTEGRRPGWTKPKLGQLEKAIPRPKLKQGADVGGDVSEEDEEDELRE